MSDERFWSKVVRTDGCWNWTAHRSKRGYGRISIGGRLVMAHRYSYESANGPIPSGLYVCHTRDNPRCVNPAHLFLGTKRDNNADMVAKGRQVRGETNGRAKLTAESVRHIRAVHGTKKSTSELAIEHGVSRQQIRDIVKRRKWAHVDPQWSPT